MQKSSFVWIIITIIIFSLLSFNVLSCGCGLALSDMKVFNDLKETQAYLLIDVESENSYREMPFFRMVSMDEPYNVTIVFPMKDIPYDVQGRLITADVFLRDYGVGAADGAIKVQSFSGVTKKIGTDIKEGSAPAFALSNGFLGLSFAYFGTLSAGAFQKDGSLAHYDFEGGSLDIYDLKSVDTLDEFVKSLNLNMTGEVEKLVMKYKDYYVAVLYLKVPSVLSKEEREMLKVCPEETRKVKDFLQEKTSITIGEERDLTNGICEQPLTRLIDAVTRSNYLVNGTLVDMRFKSKVPFKAQTEFFYPTSIVNYYKYPITDQKYFIKTPLDLHIDLKTSKVSDTVTLDSGRWYKVTSTLEDIDGIIVKASFIEKFGDSIRKVIQKIYWNTGWIAFFIYILIYAIPFIIYTYKYSDALNWKEILLIIPLFIVGGFLLCGIVMLFKGKRRFAWTVLGLWAFLLALWTVSAALG